jgi:hypothetical protein
MKCARAPVLVLLCGGLLLTGVSSSLTGGQTPPPKRPPAAKPAAGLTVGDVIKLVQGGVSEDLVVSVVLSPQQILQLKKANVSDNIIRVMLDPAAAPAPTASPPEAQPAPSILPPVPAADPPAMAPAVPAGAPVSPAAAATPEEPGVYWLKQGGELVRLEGKAVSNVRTGSRLASSVTLGIKRSRINAQLRGPRAESRLREPKPQFYFYLPEEASIGDYLLVRLAQREDVRQIEIGQRTLWKTQAGVDHRKEEEFTYQRVKPRLYLVTPNRPLDPGEYGFFVAAGVETKKPSGRIYDFGVDP